MNSFSFKWNAKNNSILTNPRWYDKPKTKKARVKNTVISDLFKNDFETIQEQEDLKISPNTPNVVSRNFSIFDQVQNNPNATYSQYNNIKHASGDKALKYSGKSFDSYKL